MILFLCYPISQLSSIDTTSLSQILADQTRISINERVSKAKILALYTYISGNRIEGDYNLMKIDRFRERERNGVNVLYYVNDDGDWVNLTNLRTGAIFKHRYTKKEYGRR